MRLRDVGEFGLIARIERVARGVVAPGVVVGIGDDAAVLRPRAGEDVVVSTDALVEGVHFRWSTQAARTVGRRALLVALSDLSAMGARPLGFTVALTAPPGLALARAQGVARGLTEVAREAGCPLVGGNVTRADVTSLAVTVLGAVRRGRALLRSAARPGDRLFLTGSAGGAALALARAERRRAPLRHLPPLRLAAGRALARLPGCGACIDVSDGLLADLGHVLDASRVGAEVDVRRVPVPPRFAAACRREGLDATRAALTGGEDYELLFTLRSGAPGAPALARRLGVPVTEIGRIAKRRGLRLRGLPAGWARGEGGFRHF